MADPSSRRMLAAILSAAAVGYSRFMAANEAATHRDVQVLSQKIIARLARRGGRVVNVPSGSPI